MQRRVLWISPFRTALVTLLISFALSYPAIGIMWFFNQYATKPGILNWVILTIFPLLISICFSVFAALGALTYNVIAKFGFGVTFRVEPNPPLNSDAPPSGGAPVS